jgi:oxygen-independent coproporphyrinogen-3 oxidase
MKKPGLYVHIPFCRAKCPYCGFFSVGSKTLVSRYIEALKKEASLYKDSFPPFDTIYLGGGTPSLLGLKDLEEILECLYKYFRFSKEMETTIEANPRDMIPEKVKGFRDLGFNRINLGVQSFCDRHLQFLGRTHSALNAEKAMKTIRAIGFKNVGIDLIYGFQGQSIEDWKRTLGKSILFKPEHISCYQLTYERKTPFLKMKENGVINAIDEDKESDFFLTTSSYLEEKGYIHYEISNFAKCENHFSRHNTKYWEHIPYLGLGPSAHSFRNSKRWWNINSIRKYCDRLDSGILPIEGEETLTDEQISLEQISLGLRTRKGIELDKLPETPETRKAVSSLQEYGYLEIIENRIVPTKKGFLISDRLPLLILR